MRTSGPASPAASSRAKPQPNQALMSNGRSSVDVQVHGRQVTIEPPATTQKRCYVAWVSGVPIAVVALS